MLHDVADDDVAVDIARTIVDDLRQPFHDPRPRAHRDREHRPDDRARATDEIDAEAVLHEADAAMYDAKSKGGDRVSMFDQEVWTRTVRRIETEQALRHAIDHDELFLEYQPVYDLDDGAHRRRRGAHPVAASRTRPRSRRRSSSRSPRAPSSSCRSANGCSTRCARRSAPGRGSTRPARSARAWVNVSGRQLARPQFPAVVEAALQRYGLEPTALGLELTESTLIDEAETPGTELRDIEALGVRVAIDDFGTGYSSLLYLLRFRVDILKIDRTFVSGLGTSDESTAIVEAVIGLAHTLGMTRQRRRRRDRPGSWRSSGASSATRPADSS